MTCSVFLIQFHFRENLGEEKRQSFAGSSLSLSSLCTKSRKFPRLNSLRFLSFFPQDTVFMSGTNIVGVLPGKYINTARDRPVIIGAHWDVVANTSGYNDNGSGMAVMLEVLRTLTSKDCYKPDYTVIFVAFDLEEPGCFGSLEFVKEFVMPKFVRKGELQRFCCDDLDGCLHCRSINSQVPRLLACSLWTRWATWPSRRTLRTSPTPGRSSCPRLRERSKPTSARGTSLRQSDESTTKTRNCSIGWR